MQEDDLTKSSCVNKSFFTVLEGLTECAEDNDKTRVMEICKVLEVKEDFVASNLDIAHRVGRPNAERCKGKKPRPVIIRFTSRTAQDITWNGAKGNDFRKKDKMYFKEDLMIKESALRILLWP